VRLYKFNAAGTSPLMTLTLSTLPDKTDDLFAPSLDVAGNRAYVTFARTIAGDPDKGNATIMQARGPSSSSSNWKTRFVTKSPAQFSKNLFGQPCDSFVTAGCIFASNTLTLVDAKNSRAWSIGPVIIQGDNSGKETNWIFKGFGLPQ